VPGTTLGRHSDVTKTLPLNKVVEIISNAYAAVEVAFAR